MKVLHLTLSLAPGGRRQAIATLLRRLPQAGADCELACLDGAGCPMDEVTAVSPSATILNRKGVLDLAAMKRLVRVCRERSVDVIHAHDAASQFAGMCARMARPKTRLLMTFHRSLGFESRSRRDRLRNALATAASAAVIVGSRERRDHFLAENHVSSRKVVRIPFGIDTAKFRPCPETRSAIRTQLGIGADDLVIGAVGHFGPEKGIDVVLRGFNELIGRKGMMPSNRLWLVICGRGTAEQEQTMRQLAAAGNPQQVRFAGFQSDIWRWFQAFDMLAHAPRQEAFGLVLIEAMAAGLSVVATSVGGIPDIVRTGQTGILIPTENPQEVASALKELKENETLRRSMSLAARETAVAEYDADVYARRHAALYEAILAGRQPVGADEEDRADRSRQSVPQPSKDFASSLD